jgi:hypothetical protein
MFRCIECERVVEMDVASGKGVAMHTYISIYRYQ